MSDAKRFLMTVGYDGTAFKGWQVQPGARTVQGEIEAGIARVSGGAAARIHASGRTDTGVHARGQTFHFDAPRPEFDAAQWVKALNGVLPEDVRMFAGRAVPADFHARFDAVRKEYRYFVFCGRVMPPELRFTRLREPAVLDFDAMRAACGVLTGEHDFRAFSAIRVAADENTVRRMHELSIQETEDGFYVRAVSGGFLYRMVRQLTGTLLRVGRGELTVEDVVRVLKDGVRTPDTVSAPPQGLFLWRVAYDPGDSTTN
ncbi:MAG: tRNA pseudouridine(38-40) synthase TruA [Verrucomicrobia bacterium]|nr:tRNA pseudouridine(38-40) synthase TruA [Verrucomicrobiota bacterium]MCH8528806.1 tRNA pseudouridine(38-40) synthase TruA [Kiritimatiellia bacterium]